MERTLNLFKSKQEPLFKFPYGVNKAKNILSNLGAILKNLRAGSDDIRFNSILLTGPKGTGKTLFADSLIRSHNLDYIKINSSSFINFEEGTESNAMAALLNLLKHPKKEIVVVLEEADIILNRPAYKSKIMDLLKWVKTNNTKFVLIVCAENKASLDHELLSLIDHDVEFKLPTKKQRKSFLVAHVKFILKKYEGTGLAQIIRDILSDAKIDEIAEKSDGYSYAKLEVLVNNIKVRILEHTNKFTKELVDKTVQENLASHAALTA